MKIVAFLPVKGSSERIKNKNTTLMNGKPLFLHTLENLAFPEVHVDSQKNTDDNEPADPHGDVAIDNLAVPEVKVKDHKKK